MPYFVYGERELAYLAARDPQLGEAFARIGPLRREVIPELFPALVNAVAGQQISTKAWQTVWSRLQMRFSPMTPEKVLAAGPDTVISCGLSRRKADYILGIAQEIRAGTLSREELEGLSDREVCERLSRLRGIGVWTAEMVLLFSLCRPNVFSTADFGIRRGLQRLHGKTVSPTDAAAFKALYTPYGTVASLYLWEIATRDTWPPADRADKK